MAKVLSTKMGTTMTTKNSTPPKGKPNIGPGSTAGSAKAGVTQKPSVPKTVSQYKFNAGTMPNRKPVTIKNTSVFPGKGNVSLPKARGAMPKFRGK
jgi:hypothetical protein